MGFVETHSALLVPCRRVSMYTNGKYPPNILRENPENHVVSLNPSLCLACMALMPWPPLLLLGSWRSTVLSFTMLWPSCFSILLLEFHLLFSAWRPWCCPPPRALDLGCSPFPGLAPHPQRKPFWSPWPAGGTVSIQSISSPLSYLFPSSHLPEIDFMIWNYWLNFKLFVVCAIPLSQEGKLHKNLLVSFTPSVPSISDSTWHVVDTWRVFAEYLN